jgi:hypothetical protein
LIDFSSATWLYVSELLKNDLDRARDRIGAIGISEAETNAIRGEIQTLKRILALPEKIDREREISLY